MNGLNEYWIPYVVSNIVAIIILISAIWRPRLGRLWLVLLFGWACGTNYYLSHSNPNAYLDYANMSIPLYTTIIRGWFSQHITVLVTLIAVGQAAIAVGMLLKGGWVKLACTGAIVFLLAIAPLGVGSGFPFSLWVSGACIAILVKDKKRYLWVK